MKMLPALPRSTRKPTCLWLQRPCAMQQRQTRLLWFAAVKLASRPGQSCVIFMKQRTQQRVKKCETQTSPHFSNHFCRWQMPCRSFWVCVEMVLLMYRIDVTDNSSRMPWRWQACDLFVPFVVTQFQKDLEKNHSFSFWCKHSLLPSIFGGIVLFRGIKKPLNHWRFRLGMVSPFEVSPGKTCAISRRPNAFLLSWSPWRLVVPATALNFATAPMKQKSTSNCWTHKGKWVE